MKPPENETEATQAPSATTASILRDILSRKMNRNPAFSLRAFARDLGVSHTYLSLVMNGKKQLSMKKIVEFIQILGLEQAEANLFLKAGSRESRGRAFAKAKSSKRGLDADSTPYFELETDRFRYLSDWYHLAILDLTLIRGFKNNSKWIARRLGLSVTQVDDAIERLKRLDLLETRDGKLTKKDSRLIVHSKLPDAAIRAFHRQMMSKAIDILEAHKPEDLDARDISAVTIPINPAKLAEAKRRIKTFRRSLWNYLSDEHASELYQFNLQLFPLSREADTRTKAAVLRKAAKKRGQR
jgi:uncharacterized protein (TIGR02147 family)